MLSPLTQSSVLSAVQTNKPKAFRSAVTRILAGYTWLSQVMVPSKKPSRLPYSEETTLNDPFVTEKSPMLPEIENKTKDELGKIT